MIGIEGTLGRLGSMPTQALPKQGSTTNAGCRGPTSTPANITIDSGLSKPAGRSPTTAQGPQ
eukprot:5513893-Pyramimonas_sp.AAC.1